MYEYIDGATVGDRDLTAEQTRQFSAIVAELHSFDADIPVETGAIAEDFHVPFLRPLKAALEESPDKLPDDVSGLIAPRLDRIYGLIEDVERLSAFLQSRPPRMALCHTDLHNWNLMQAGEQLMVIDWEGLKLAPVEADLMFLVDRPDFDVFMEHYRSVHPDFEINFEALRFYQGRRKLEDIWEFMEQLLFDDQNEQERAATKSHLTKELDELGE